ncbi:hypothetical protein GKQ77_15290 [Streptomyces sp. BG9H]|uniref:DUF2336 domain-containing protein n=1 Tax=Streptomyces anatolicus TaxID=2675858 RepID=A0ABS6YNB5_9ACTN|nr:hypothetical protein [Streptomyces anatolicus]MBW5422914.1 hypothetical protein [Streptomyces anatolicus]
MDKLRARAETLKTARLLDIEPDTLAFLQALPVEDVRRFRALCVAALHDRAPDMLDRIASATKLVPAGVAAAISQKALGPRLAAAVAGRLEPARAADIIEKLPVSFIAESCGHLDPRRIQGTVDRLDENLVVRIAVTLAERGDHLTMGRFVGHLPDSALRRILPQVDDAAVLRTGFAIEEPERLGQIIELMGPDRLASVIGSASEAGLWPEALAVAGMVTGEQRGRIASLAAAQPEDRLDSLVVTVAEQDLWESLLPLVALLGEEERRAVAALPSLRGAGVLGGVVRAVVATGLWAEFLPLVGALPEESRKVVADAAGALPASDLDVLALEVDKRDLWELVMPLVELMDDEAKTRIFELPAFQRQAGE